MDYYRLQNVWNWPQYVRRLSNPLVYCQKTSPVNGSTQPTVTPMSPSTRPTLWSSGILMSLGKIRHNACDLQHVLSSKQLMSDPDWPKFSVELIIFLVNKPSGLTKWCIHPKYAFICKHKWPIPPHISSLWRDHSTIFGKNYLSTIVIMKFRECRF